MNWLESSTCCWLGLSLTHTSSRLMYGDRHRRHPGITSSNERGFSRVLWSLHGRGVLPIHRAGPAWPHPEVCVNSDGLTILDITQFLNLRSGGKKSDLSKVDERLGINTKKEPKQAKNRRRRDSNARGLAPNGWTAEVQDRHLNLSVTAPPSSSKKTSYLRLRIRGIEFLKIITLVSNLLHRHRRG